ncbi:MAG TPA: hypothetical protein DCE76_08935 [Anaerolineaceae bacterium]|nr:hypothetical protein [Anaerolineaceae bacterium]
MIRNRLAPWGMALILLAAAVFPLHVTAQSEPPDEITPQENYTVFLPMVRRSSTTSPTPTPSPRPTIIPNPQLGNIIDHTTLPLYDQIPPEYLRAAEQICFFYFDRSVGQNISEGLDCLASRSWRDSVASCRNYYTDSSLTSWKTFTVNDSNIPEVILFPGGNNRDKIHFEYYQADYWYNDVRNLVERYPSLASQWDIISLKHNYLHVGEDSTIARDYFNPNYNGYNIYDILELEARYPNKTFVYWTSSLARNTGSSVSESFNNQMREWARQNNKILLDIADILSHTPDGRECRNSQGYAIICREYTTNPEGGHLGSVSAGKIRIAKAIWILLAQLAGWQGP